MAQRRRTLHASAATDLASVRGLLEAERARLLAERDALQAGLDEALSDNSVGAGNDPADSGSSAYGREQELSLLQSVGESLTQTEHALARIADGRYGICESCGEPIGAARLEAFPRATLCVSCKHQQERR